MRCNSNGKRPLIPQSRKQLKIRGKQGFSISRQGTQSKIAETYKQETEEKRKLNRKNGREPSDDKFYTINFFPLANGEII